MKLLSIVFIGCTMLVGISQVYADSAEAVRKYEIKKAIDIAQGNFEQASDQIKAAEALRKYEIKKAIDDAQGCAIPAPVPLPLRSNKSLDSGCHCS